MKALSLWQPWASLMADGRKKVETRSWPPPTWLLGKELAIHATMKVEKSACEDFGYDALIIPRGCIVAVVRLIAFEKFKDTSWMDYSTEEVSYGDFSMGRYGWKCELIEKLNPPLMVRGYQGLFDWVRGDSEASGEGRGKG